MDERDWLAERFEDHRPHLRAAAYRVLGSVSEADDAVQETWLRLSRSGTDGVENLGGWLTTIVARVSLNMPRSRVSRREEPMDPPVTRPADGTDPEHEAVLADSVGLALLVVLDTLTPAERLAFVLHDMFTVLFEEGRGGRPALIDGAAGAVWAQGGKTRVVFVFTITGGKVAAIEMIADPEHLGRLEVVPG